MLSNSRSQFSQFRLAGGLALAACLYAGSALAQPNMFDFSSVPPLIADSAPPNVMLVMSNDHELYKKAYPDYSDLDGDGILDTTYNDSFTYSGYFDSNFCYNYDSGSGGRFTPVTDISSQSSHRCDSVSGDWSGNFLNWATMTRMDIVRHVFYGGYRSADTAITLLERVYLPEDAHAFVKVFRASALGANTAYYTPYNNLATGGSISLCNVSTIGDGSVSDKVPLLRVGYGDWPVWSATERNQCYYRSESNSGYSDQPTSSDRPSLYDLTVRVEACKVGVDADSNRCRAYTDSGSGDISYKPAGLLQQYGERGEMNFGLITGSYQRNMRGGILRKNITPLAGNGDANDEIDLDTGRFINDSSGTPGIINTLNRLRLVNWNPGQNYTDCNNTSTYKITVSELKSGSSSSIRCRNWGNPLSEIYLEALRYFSGSDGVSGVTPTGTFNSSDSALLGLPRAAWSDPLDSENYCATCSIVVLSTGLNSFDADHLGTVSDLWREPGSSRMSTGWLNTIVDSIGSFENITNGSYLVGDNGSVNDGVCTAKTVSNLSSVRGLCPEIPSLEGSMQIAGLAYHAHSTDLRNDYEGIQSVSTYSVGLAESLPSFDLNVNDKSVSFVPTCQGTALPTDTSSKLDMNDSDRWVNCSFLDVVVEEQGPQYGSIYIVWEDALGGQDFDMDGISRIEYCIGADTSACRSVADIPNVNLNNFPSCSGACNGYTYSDFEWRTTGLTADSIQFRTSLLQSAGGKALRFGYTLSGVADGSEQTLVTNTPTTALSTNGISGGKHIVRYTPGNGDHSLLLARGGINLQRLSSNSGNRMLFHAPALYTASDNVETGKLLQNPLWYTAKYGNFNDLDGDGTPCFNGDCTDTREWDVRDVMGVSGPDGIPDNFFPVGNPSHLVTSLSQIFQVISERISSGTAAAVVANSSTGLGAVYQAYYHPKYTDPENRTLSWGGVLHAMFIDESGRFREDNGTKGQLDGTGTDYVIDIFYDQTVVPNRTRFQRYLQTGSGATATLAPFGAAEDLENIGSIWNARDVLADIPQSDMVLQRNLSSGVYSEPAQDKRYIFTFLDSMSAGTVGEVDAGEIVDFVAATFDPGSNNNYRYMGLDNPSIAPDLVDYIRGQDKAGWRSRLVDIPGDGSTAVKHWVLGDIVHSSPLVVNPPSQRYDVQYADETYREFKQQYSRRRQMIYVGANDGMLHAFNGGVWDPATQTFHNQAWDSASETFSVGPSHELGAEMWAYVPMNLLPHLQWLKEPDYNHVYFVDAPPRAYDVNIFPDDAVHPNGWGTILVVGMRLGGGSFPVDLNGDSVDETTMRSAYVILDITDPERPPSLIAEITDADLGFTTSIPTLVKTRRGNPTTGSYTPPDANRWMLVFGSGPDALSTATSTREAKLYAYDLVARDMVTIHSNAQVPAGSPNGFFGDFLAVGWSTDYQDDVIYVGTVEGSEVAPSGRLKRILLADTADMGLASGFAQMSDFINVGQPITASPTTRVDVGRNERWVSFGTGRLFTREDNKTTTLQSYYGIKEPTNYNTTGLTPFSLVNTTNIIVESNGAIHAGAIGNQVTIDDTDLDSFAELYSFMDSYPGWIRNLGFNGSDPSERVFSGSLTLGSTVVYSSYVPNVDICTIEGSGFLTAVNFRTGTAEVFSPLGEDGDGVVFTSISLGQGAPSTPAAIVRTGVEPVPDSDGSATGGGDLSIITGATTGVTESTGFTAAPGSGGRMSWEMLEIPF